MSKGDRRDLLRQAANVVGAIFQVVAPAFTGAAIGTVSDQNSTLVVPAGYAFVIWSPIFLLAFVYAAYQALPSRRRDPLLRRLGWFSALAFLSNGVWELLFPARQFVLSQVVFLGIFVFAGLSYLIVQRAAEPGDSGIRRWLLAPAFGLLFGWVTAAFLVGFATVLVATGVQGAGVGAALTGAVLLLCGGVVASAAVLAGSRGPATGYLAYGGAVLWALAAVVANQYDASLLTTGAAVVAAIPVVLAIARSLGEARTRPDRTGRPTTVL